MTKGHDMAYADLTAEQKASIQALAQQVRPLAGQFARMLEDFRTVASYYSGNVETMLSGLDASDEIPNESGLAGAQPLTKELFANLIGYMITASTPTDGATGSYNTNYHRALYAKAAGPGNIITG